MPTWVIVLIVVAVIVLVAAAFLAKMASSRKARRAELQERFGPEYDRMVDGGSRSKAERELAERERRHAELDIKPLPEADRTRFAQSWQETQLSFLDDPTKAVHEAESLINKVLTARGYPSTDDLAAREAELSVEHARQLANLRAAQTVSAAATSGEATTEDLRQAMVRYRALFADLLRVSADGSAGTADGQGSNGSRDGASAYPAEPEQRVRVIPSATER
jgi:FtsZ-interacting cell division protein ZipA